MRVSIKLFLTLTGFTFFIILTTLLLTRWSFQQGFIEYTRGIEELRLQRNALSLTEVYISADYSWQTIKQQGLKPFTQRRPPRPKGHAPHKFELPPIRLHGDDPANKKPSKRGGPPPPPLSLFDADGEFVAGRIGRTNGLNVAVPILLNGKIIGELRSSPKAFPVSGLSSAFLRHQLISTIGIGLLCLILSAIVSWWLTKQILAPLNNLRNKITLLTLGDFSTTPLNDRADEIGELMHDLSILSNTLDKSRDTQKRWIADISHELRTPLTILTGEVEAIRDGIRQFDTASLESIHQEVGRLTHLVNDLYQLSLSDIGGLNYQMVRDNIVNVLKSAIESSRVRANEKGIDIHFDKCPAMYAQFDYSRIDQLFLNLLNNAITYTDTPGLIRVNLRQDKQTVFITIEDSKPGVTQENRALIFDPLFRTDASRVRSGSGAGLGLTICKNIVDAHGGDIQADKSELGGLLISISLPKKSTCT